MPYVDRQNRICGFLDIEENEKFQRRYFILDTQSNVLLWYMDNPQNLPSGTSAVGSLRLTYISKVSEATAKQKPKAEFCFVINALSRRYFLQANDHADLKEWVTALNNATKITVPKVGSVQQTSEVPKVTAEQQVKRHQPYKTEIIGGVVVHTPINQNEGEEMEPGDSGLRAHTRGLPSCVPGMRPGVVRWGFCVKQGNVRKSWKRRFFTLDDSSVSYFKCDTDKDPLRSIALKDIQKVHECLVKSGELLMRDNLFEIITSFRTFYIQEKAVMPVQKCAGTRAVDVVMVQKEYSFAAFGRLVIASQLNDKTDTPEDMQGWIKAISEKIQDLRGPIKDSVFSRSTSLYGSNTKALGQGPRRRQVGPMERKPPLTKSCSVAPSWQPWTPVPSSSTPRSGLLTVDEGEGSYSSLPTLLGGPEEGMDPTSCRRRHRSHPTPNSEKVFPFTVDDDGMRTTDV